MLARSYIMVKVFRNRFVVTRLGSSPETLTANSPDPFSTDRLLIGNFSVAERALSEAVRRAVPLKWGWLRPPMSGLVHPLEMSEGGLSQVENRILVEVAEGAGIDQVVVWPGSELSAAEALDRLRRP